MLLLIFATIVCVATSYDHEEVTATFSVDNTGIDGYVSVQEGTVAVWLNLSLVDTTSLPGGESCYADGFKYHIHESWTYGDNVDRIGESACSGTYTSLHWDPWNACGGATGSDYCTRNGGCIPYGGSVNGNLSDDVSDNYDCTDYATDPFVCEVGDWSGKYGALTGTDLIFSRTDSSAWEVVGPELYQNKSVVFHCGDTGKRAFCAFFYYDNLDYIDDSSTSIDQGGDNGVVRAEFDTYCNTGDAGDCYIELTGDDSTITIDIDNTKTNLDVGTSDYCDDSTVVVLSFYDSWTATADSAIGNSDCSSAVGNKIDPGINCPGDGAWSGSDFDNDYCHNNQSLCNVADYDYSCPSYVTDASTWRTNRYACAATEISHVLENIDTSGAVSETYDQDTTGGIPFLWPPTSSLVSVGATCASGTNEGNFVFCAKVAEYTAPDVATTAASSADSILYISFSILYTFIFYLFSH